MKMKRKDDRRILDVHDHLVLKDDGSVFALFEIPSNTASVTDDEAKEKAKQMLFYTLYDLIPSRHFDIFTLPMDRDLVGNYEFLVNDLSEDTFSMAKYMLNGSLDKLEGEFGALYEYHSFISVPLIDNYVSTDISKVVKKTARNVRKEVWRMVRKDVDFPADWYEDYQELAETVEKTLSLLLPRRLTTGQTRFIYRLQYLRGLAYSKDQEMTLIDNSVQNLDEVLVRYLANGMMLFKNDYSKSYVKELPLSELPDNVSYMHVEEALKTLKFPVEVLTKVYFNKQRGVFSLRNRSRRAKGRLKQNTQEAAEKDSQQKGSIISSIVKLEDVEDRDDAKERFLSYLMTLVITGDSISEVEGKQEALMRFLTDFDIELSPARADQRYLLHKNLLGTELTTSDKNWVQPISLEGFCENLFFVTQKVGVDIGFYGGRVDSQLVSYAGDTQKAIHDSNNFVFLNLLISNELGIKGKRTSNPHTAIIGDTGGGKSFLTKNLFIQCSLMKSQVLYVDPKAEMRQQFLKVLKEYKQREASLKENEESYQPIIDYIEQVHFVTLDARDEKNWGALDPLVYLKGQEAKDLAESMITEILPTQFNNLDFMTAFSKAMNVFMVRRENGEKVGMLSVLQYLQASENENVSKVASLLIEKTSNSLLSLAFYDGSNSAVSMDNRITVLEITGLDLPSEQSEHLTSQQQKSLALMYSLGYFCMWFGKQDRSKKTVTFFDEAWFFTSSSIGAGILKEMKRVGRSFNNFLVYVTQSVKDLKDSNDQTSFGNVFAFLEPNEVTEVLEYLKIPVNEKSIEMMETMTTTGQCVYKDVFGRVARMTVDGMFPEIYKLFDTVESELIAKERVA